MPHDLSLRCRSPCHRRDDDGGGGGHRAGADAAVTAMVNSHGHPNDLGEIGCIVEVPVRSPSHQAAYVQRNLGAKFVQVCRDQYRPE